MWRQEQTMPASVRRPVGSTYIMACMALGSSHEQEPESEFYKRKGCARVAHRPLRYLCSRIRHGSLYT
jgi:hypothetical protein